MTLKRLRDSATKLYEIQKEFYNKITRPFRKIYRKATKPILKKYKKIIFREKTLLVHYKKDLKSFNKYLVSAKKIKRVSRGQFYNCCIDSIQKHSKKITVVSPAIEINKYKDIYIYGRSGFIANKSRKILYIDNVIKKTCSTSKNSENKKVISENAYHSKLGAVKRKFNKGILLCGQCSGNYAHWLTELLPKICYVDLDLRYKDYPLVMDNWNHRIFEESAQFVSKYKREIIKVNQNEEVFFKELVDISPTSYIPITPPQYSGKLSVYQFSNYALQKLRLCAHKKIKDTIKESCKKRLFLKRKIENTGNKRLLINSQEIELAAEKLGYFIVDPADLTFDNQVLLFSETTHIVAPIGASLCNLVFNNKNPFDISFDSEFLP
jgi:hypothetical protein